MTSSLRTTAAIAVLAVGVLLAGCSSKPSTPPVTIGSLPADIGPTIPLNGALGRYGSFRDWPSACELVTDETLKSLLPQITTITREPEVKRYDVRGLDLIKVPGGIEVPEGRCMTKFSIPVGMLASNAGTLHTDILAAGSPEFVKLNLDQAPTTPMDVKGGSCGTAPDGIRCLDASGKVHYRMSFQLPHHGPSLKDPSRYEHNGEIVSFTTSNQDTQPRNDYLDTNLIRPIVQSTLDRFGNS